MLLQQFIREGAGLLGALYPAREARALVERLVQDVQGLGPYAYIVDPSLEASDAVREGLSRLLAGEPLQYITGWQEFYGRRFKVNPGVLIPRPETEILVREAVVRALELETPRVLDLCTGSGCIAWSIALEVQGARVTAVDLSDEALSVARVQNPGLLHPERERESISGANQGFSAPRFVKADVLKQGEYPGGPFDILTANPPYIMESEKARMHPNVLEHEPAMALFVPDEDSLVFCRAIAGCAAVNLRPGGWGIVEINESLGPQTARVFESAGLQGVKIIKDYSSRDRFVSFQT